MDKHAETLLLSLVLLATTSAGLARELTDVPRKNPFAQPEILVYKPPSQSPVSGKRSALPTSPPQLQLTATLISISEPMVIVNGNLLNVGDEIEGMTLVVVDEGRAVFRFRGKNHVYTIDEDKPGQTR